MKLTNEQHEQLLAALDLLKQADAEDINTVIDAHDGEDERLSTIVNLRQALEQSISRLNDDLVDEIAYYEEHAAGHEEDGDAGERMAFALVSVFTKRGEVWGEPIPGIGGSMMIAKERSGLYNSDEAYKMAVTDALSVAFKALGVAAEIYMGNWDGSKYKNDPAPSFVPDSALLDTLTLIETAPDMQMLSAAFADAWNRYKADKNAAGIITEAKDKRKKELS
jgi:hypothetical protein